MKQITFLILFLIVSWASAQTLQPHPKEIINLSQSIFLDTELSVHVEFKNEIEQKAANYLERLIGQKFNNRFSVAESESKSNWEIVFNLIPYSDKHINDQYYELNPSVDKKIIEISSPSQLGLLYGAVTFIDLLINKDDRLNFDMVEIKDYPDFSRRLLVANPSPNEVSALFDLALQNKFETVVIASRQHPWYKLSDEYLSILKEIKIWKDKYGGPKVMQSHNVYEEKKIIISNDSHINALKEVIETSYLHGIEKLMILSDDTPPYKFGEGYILVNENDKKTFPHFEAANTYLMNELENWFNEKNYNIESYYVPAYYTYEDMHQGDIELFIGTQWESGALEPLYRDLEYIGTNMNESIFLIWCGPYVRSRIITKEHIDDWTKNLSGRVPFLWDNTIYSHHPFTSTPLFTAYENEFPNEFYLLTGGNGIFINGDFNLEDHKVAAITANDYMWNPNDYNPELSLKQAIVRMYGSQLYNPLLEFKEKELEMRKVIGQRKLWFETEKLWQQIRNVRFVTDKNPFDYHLNYTRLKGLRLQLKSSVPEPKSKEDFISECKVLEMQREQVLNKIKSLDESVFMRIKKLAIELPDFETID